MLSETNSLLPDQVTNGLEENSAESRGNWRSKTGLFGMALDIRRPQATRASRVPADAAAEKTMKESALKDLDIDERRDIYNAENQLTTPDCLLHRSHGVRQCGEHAAV
jgi:hypothetical protein